MSSDDLQLFYQIVGEGLPGLVMHGMGFDHTLLHPWLDRLPGYRLVYYDHRANGRSQAIPLETMTLDTLIADAEWVRAQLGVPQVTVLAHSNATVLALEYALRYPENVQHVILLNPFPAWDPAFNLVAQAEAAGATREMLAAFDFSTMATDNDFRAAWNIVSPLYFADRKSTLALDIGRKVLFSHAALKRGFALFAGAHCLADFHRLSMPALVLTGRHDFVAPPAHAEELAKALSRGHLQILEHSGHFPYAEEPESFTQAVLGWQDTFS